jgi:hypothetical protein
MNQRQGGQMAVKGLTPTLTPTQAHGYGQLWTTMDNYGRIGRNRVDNL